MVNEFTKYKRHPILIGDNSVVLLNILSGPNKIEDIWTIDPDLDAVMEQHYNQFKEAADQFIKQFEGHYCVAFLEELIKASYNQIKKDDAYHPDTQHHKRVLEYFENEREGNK